MDLLEIARLKNRQTGRCSSWDTSGRNADSWMIPAGQSRVLADIKGPGIITHLWLTQRNHYRECLLKITWDDAKKPSVLVPLGDFFCLGHGIVNSFQSALFTASTQWNNRFDEGCALNCYVPMPFRKRAVVELINEGQEAHRQYFYVDYETGRNLPADLGYFHAEFRRTNPFGGWAPEIMANAPQADVVNKERQAWDNNYVILETKGRGHYLGCNLSVTNFQGTWWGEGDDMIWVDGYKWPPDLHGTGSEDYLNQAWGMQDNALLHNGSSIFETNTIPGATGQTFGGCQTSYVFHLENPVRFQKSIKATIEHGHANHLANEMSSVAYWYADKPTRVLAPPPVAQRMPVRRGADGQWLFDKTNQCPGKPVRLTADMLQKKAAYASQAKLEEFVRKEHRLSARHSQFVLAWQVSRLFPSTDVRKTRCVRLSDKLGWQRAGQMDGWLASVRAVYGGQNGLVYLAKKFRVAKSGEWILHLGHDGGAKAWMDGRQILCDPKLVNPATYTRSRANVKLTKGAHELVVAFDTHDGRGWGICFSWELPAGRRRPEVKPVFPVTVQG